MKHKYFILILLSCFSSSAFGYPMLLEKNYTNYAWGYHNQGCLIDTSGFVYTYDIAHKKPLEYTGRQISAEEVQTVSTLLSEAAKGKFSVRQAAADAGALLWSGFLKNRTVKLKLWGDYEGENSSPSAAEIVKIIDKNCPEIR